MAPVALIRPKGYSWKETNLSSFGSIGEKQVKKETAIAESAWNGLDKIDEDTLKIWRINNFKLEPVPDAEYGTFYGGDSYIVLKISKNNEGRLNYDAHFWIGSESTTDEYGTAAYKTVELDTFLDDRAAQHREVQDFESDLFMSYFDKLEILNGGYASGFRHVDVNEYKPRLLWFHIAGRNKPPVISEVPFTKQCLVSADVFILDNGTSAIQWNGSQSNGREKTAAAAFLQQLENERFGKCLTNTIDENDFAANKEFLSLLPDDPIPTNSLGHKPKELAKHLFKISNENGKLEFSILSKDSAPRHLVNEDDVFLIHGTKGLVVYLGQNSSHEEKANALSYAHAYLMRTEDKLVPITVVKSGTNEQLMNQILD